MCVLGCAGGILRCELGSLRCGRRLVKLGGSFLLLQRCLSRYFSGGCFCGGASFAFAARFFLCAPLVGFPRLDLASSRSSCARLLFAQFSALALQLQLQLAVSFRGG